MYFITGSLHDLFKVTVNGINCTCFLEIYHQKYDWYTNAIRKMNSYKRPCMFVDSEEYQCGLQISTLSIELENLERNFNAIIVQMLKAVKCLHTNGLVHRDIKRKYINT